jgi:hypothetical protein
MLCSQSLGHVDRVPGVVVVVDEFPDEKIQNVQIFLLVLLLI